jgi:hypothetical protein
VKEWAETYRDCKQTACALTVQYNLDEDYLLPDSLIETFPMATESPSPNKTCNTRSRMSLAQTPVYNVVENRGYAKKGGSSGFVLERKLVGLICSG